MSIEIKSVRALQFKAGSYRITLPKEWVDYQIRESGLTKEEFIDRGVYVESKKGSLILKPNK